MPDVLSGRDLSEAVAKAFGFKPRVLWAVLTEDESALMIDFEREAEARKWWDEHPSVHDKYHLGTLDIFEPYAESTEAAFRVVQKMREQGWSFQLDTVPIGCPADVKSPERRWSALFDSASSEMIAAYAPTAAEAICLAALNALGEKNGK